MNTTNTPPAPAEPPSGASDRGRTDGDRTDASPTDRDPRERDRDDAGPIARGPAPSPCVGVCRIVESEARCAGCLRTLDEIAGWGRLDDPARHALLDVLQKRRRDAASDQRRSGGGTE